MDRPEVAMVIWRGFDWVLPVESDEAVWHPPKKKRVMRKAARWGSLGVCIGAKVGFSG
jgi:hypothetical protein